MKTVNCLSADLYSHGKMNLKCVETCKNEGKSSYGVKKSVLII